MDTIDITRATPKPVRLPDDERPHRRERAITEIAAYASGYSERRWFKYERYDTPDGLDVLVLQTSGAMGAWSVASRIDPVDEYRDADMRVTESRNRALHALLTWAIARAGESLPPEPTDVSFDRVRLPDSAPSPSEAVNATECAILELNYGNSLAWSVKTSGAKAHVALSLVDPGAVAVGLLPWTALLTVDDQPDAIDGAKRRLRTAMLERSIQKRAKFIALRTAEHRARLAAEAGA